jgi:hypothetical protein
MRENEVDLFTALQMLDISQEHLGRMVEERKLKSRPAEGTVYFLRVEIEGLIDQQIEEARSKVGS